MAKGFRCGPGGALSIRIAAYATQALMDAASPPERTLGIVTDQAITGWSISPGKPDTTQVGFVWIRTGQSSIGAVNVLAYNELLLCPLGAQQLTADGWTERVGKTFSQGSWREWEPEVTYLFTPGDLHEDITGGWSGIESGAESLSLSVYKQASGVGVGGTVSTVTGKAVDLTDFGVLEVTLDNCDKDFAVSLLDDGGNVISTAAADGTSGTVTMNLGGIAGAYYISLKAEGSYFNNYSSASFDVSEVKLINQSMDDEMAAALNVLGVDV